VGWLGLAGSWIRYPLLANAVQRLLTAMVGQDREEEIVVHDDGAIELTETGFRRMAQAHSAGLDVVIGVDRRDVLRFPVGRQDAVDALPRGPKSQRNG
jgi:hypothetical protein